MSRIGFQPIILPDGVTLAITDRLVKVTGPKGELELRLPSGLDLAVDDRLITVNRSEEQFKPIHGTVRAILANAVHGVSKGWSKTLEIVGSGYRSSINGSELDLSMGYSHPVKLAVPEGLQVTVVKNAITVSGIDRQQVGQFAAIIRAVRKPEPYKGKGIRYEGERVRRKAGKALKSGS